MKCRNRAAWPAFDLVISLLLAAGAVIPAAGQNPVIFSVSKVSVGAKRVTTTVFLTAGKWSDATPKAGIASTQIRCYKRFDFCEIASVDTANNINISTLDIRHWDNEEMVAKDDSPVCTVRMLRADFAGKRVTLTSSRKDSANDAACGGAKTPPTAILLGPGGPAQTRDQKQ